jgi:hypothetical protein
MSNNEPEANVSSSEAAQEPALTLDDLLNAESEVLKRVGREYGAERAPVQLNCTVPPFCGPSQVAEGP